MQSVILSRVDRLAAGDKQVLQVASVLGRLFPLPVLARLAPPGLDVAAALDRLAERDFVYLERAWPEAEYSFKHVLMQEAVYGTLLTGRKTQLHRQAGEAIEALYADNLLEHYEALAHHFDRSDAGEKAVEYLLKAGEKARRAYLNDEAIGYFERALARCEQPQLLPDGARFALPPGWRRSPGWAKCISWSAALSRRRGGCVRRSAWAESWDWPGRDRATLLLAGRLALLAGTLCPEVVALGEEGLAMLGNGGGIY